ARERMDARSRRRRALCSQRDQRRSASYDVLLLPTAPGRGGAGRAHSQHPVRLQRKRDRERLRHQPRGNGEANNACEETARDIEAVFAVAAPAEFAVRLPAVHRALYLLFNEGYHGASEETAVRAELCHEAMRLAAVLLEHPLGATPATYVLSALMCLNAARLPARVDASGKLTSLFDQDCSLWDRKFKSEGTRLLELVATGRELTEYHLEAAIASVHARASRAEDTDWAAIVSLYDTLMSVSPSPVVALNRAIAIAQRDGPERGLEAIDAIED